MRKILLLSILSICLFSCDNYEDVYVYDEGQKVNWDEAANHATDALIKGFWNEAGYFNYGSNGSDEGFQYWPNAHAMDVLVDAYERTQDSKYVAYFDKWFSGIKVKNGGSYYNEFYDDMEWNGLTFLRLYEVTNDEKYLTAAKEVWADIATGWNEEYAEGGIAWRKSQLYSKNACSNGPASIMAARLYNITKEESYKEWALKIYEWEKNSLFERGTGAIYDNIDGRTNTINNVSLTYNQGTFVGAAVELYNITGDEAYLNDAQKASNFTVSKLIDTSNNILRNEGDGDNALFKGIFIRYFYKLIEEEDLNEAYRTKFISFLKNNATTVWTKGCFSEVYLFGPAWNEIPVGESQLTAQASACMLIEARAALEGILK